VLFGKRAILAAFRRGSAGSTILKKRENFSRGICRFLNPNVPSLRGGEPDVENGSLANPGIIRHRRKRIAAAITNARVWQQIEQREGFDRY